MKIIDKLIKWYLEKQNKKVQAQKKEIDDNKLKEMGKNLHLLLEFVKWLNVHGFINKHDRKVFWRSVERGEPLMERMIDNVMLKYGVKEDSLAQIQVKREEKRKKK